MSKISSPNYKLMIYGIFYNHLTKITYKPINFKRKRVCQKLVHLITN